MIDDSDCWIDDPELHYVIYSAIILNNGKNEVKEYDGIHVNLYNIK